VNFSHAIAIIVPSPFVFRMTNSGVFANDVIIGLPFIGITGGLFQSKLVDVGFERFSICIVNHA
jgi:hypothetical protein